MMNETIEMREGYVKGITQRLKGENGCGMKNELTKKW
jgi:hypothetical protein